MKSVLQLLVILPGFLFAQVSHKTVLTKAINYHDPESNWTSLNAKFYFTETRPLGADRLTAVEIDNNRSYMKLNRGDEEVYEVLHDSCQVLSEKGTVERGLTLRNYYLYLWGLPMKLNDQDTPFDQEVSLETVNGIKCEVLRVKYEKDTWYFFIDQATGRMVQYKFYQDEAETKGELIALEEEELIGQMKIPKRRSWYTLPDMKYLGTDILSKVE